MPYFGSWCGLSANLECRSEMCCAWLAGNAGRKNRQKVAVCAPSYKLVGLYLRNKGTYRQSEKIVKQKYVLHMSPQYGELRPTSTAFASWQRYCTSSSSGRQPKFAALNRGRHLCSAGRPSGWALAHILIVHSFSP